ncbi:YdeI/OmpD-associated family protein [Micromonospora sp. IBHARD004]|uniref:YdeI/OmpD-associated family protein n=1 Tax=Micromonospora sp. IBHARD004 TaxID=3457764 RepID=UPI0040586582
MAPAGALVVAEARAGGAWNRLDEVEALIVPDDLATAFDRHPGARPRWDAFPRSTRRAALEWISKAKRADTRQRRVTGTAEWAARGEWPR